MSLIELLTNCDNKQYHFVPDQHGVMRMFADQSFLIGEVVFKEYAVLVSSEANIHSKENQVFAEKTGLWRGNFALYKDFLSLSSGTRNDILNLYAPMGSSLATDFRNKAKRYGATQNWSEEKVEEFTKLCTVFKFNGFHNFKYVGNAAIAVKSSRISHSCIPNCKITGFVDCDIRLYRVVRAVAKGEEITICFDETDFDLPTFERRLSMMESKGFVCECPRCNALGDDTRQFECSDRNCSGRHYACQPTVHDVPYLLPCTECKKSPKRSCETEMFTIEAQLFSIGDSFRTEKEDAIRAHKSAIKNEKMMTQITDLHFFGPKYHCGMWGVNCHMAFCSDAFIRKSDLHQLARDIVAPLSVMKIYPNFIVIPRH